MRIPTVRTSLGRRRLAAALLAVATTGVVLAGTVAGSASAATTRGNPHPGWARTVTGQLVRVSPGHNDTPVYPEAITHPERDWMGSTIRAHQPIPSPASRPASSTATAAASVPQLPGIDVSSYQGNINWASVAPYIDFAYAKATEGNYYTNPYFYNQYVGPYNQGIIRGAYHFATPNDTGGATQADYFVNHGGGWSSDGLTLPGALDIEYNPYGSECYGLSPSQMTSWIWDFVNEYAYRTGAYPVIYSTTDWWNTCTSGDTGFANYDPLWIANYVASGGGPLPPGWGYYTFWQYADQGSEPGDQDVFNGAYTQLQTLARNG